MVEIKLAPYILYKRKIFTRNQSVKVTLLDNVEYVGVIKFIMTDNFELETEDLGIITVYANEVKDIDADTRERLNLIQSIQKLIETENGKCFLS